MIERMEINKIQKRHSLLHMTRILLGTCLCLFALRPDYAMGESYIGSKACGECHLDQYKRFTSYSKKSASWNNVAIMASDLKPFELEQCYGCHTTGYGRGGFVSIERTPGLADVGCETCHGPGGKHAASGDPALITKTPSIETCERCHSAERVKTFKFKPLIHSGAH